ncbi:MAG: phosphoribosyltransferase [Sulfolobales archaeon]|nr:phosphoribosyltransferase [Sulfolobales archaeon]MDW8082403.1 phosphoribosyltransferase [Sulfolobales archaeon]
MVKVPTKLVTWDEIVEWSMGLSEVIKRSEFKPDVVVAVSRGGYVPARLICDFLLVDNLVSLQSQHWTEAAKVAEKAIIKFPYKIELSDHRVLLVDDIVDTGDTLILARDFILSEWRPRELKIAALQWISPVAKIKPDFYYIEVKDWIWFQYPWTRHEDTAQFIKRIIVEEKEKKEWTLSELEAKFRDSYGIYVGDKYFKLALRTLVELGMLKEENNKYLVRSL